MSVLDDETSGPPSNAQAPLSSAAWTPAPASGQPKEPLDPRFGRVGIVPWSFDQTLRGVAITLIPWMAFILLSSAASSPSSASSRPLAPLEDALNGLIFILFTAVVEGAFVLAPVYFAVIRRHADTTVRDGLRALGFRRVRLLPAVGWVAGGLAVIYIANVLYEVIVTRFSLGLHTNVDTLERLGQHAPLTVIGTLIGAVFIAPFCEEIFFRGFAFPGFLRGMPVWAAVLLSALLFGITHGDVGSFVLLFVIGVVLAVVRWRTGSLWPAMALHMANNALAAIAVVLTLWPR